jgi:hypothetical protein
MIDYKWKIWYEIGTLTGNTREEWESAPYNGVLAVFEILGRKPNGLLLGKINSGVDWYWMNGIDDHIDNCGSCHEEENQWVELNAPYGASIKRGKLASNERMLEVETEIQEEISNG